MKRLLIGLLTACVVGNAYAGASIRPNVPVRNNYYYVDNKKADRAYAVAMVAIFISAVAIVASIQASEYNQGQVKILTF